MADDWAPFAATALEAWGLVPRDVALAWRSENIVLAVTDTAGERYVLRLHRPGYNSLAELESEQLWTHALRAAGVKVPDAVPLPGGRYYTAVTLPDGEERQAGLVRWISGAPLREVTQEKDSAYITKSQRELGRIAAQIHNQAAHWTVPAGFERHRLDEHGLMGEAPHWGPFWNLPQMSAAEQVTFSTLRARLFDWLAALSKAPATYSMIHADLHAYNLMVVDPSAPTPEMTVIDFDDAGYGWHTYELAVASFDADHYGPDARGDSELIEGYRALRALTDEQVAEVPIFKLIRGLAVLGWIQQRPELTHDNIRPLIEDALARAKALGFA